VKVLHSHVETSYQHTKSNNITAVIYESTKVQLTQCAVTVQMSTVGFSLAERSIDI